MPKLLTNLRSRIIFIIFLSILLLLGIFIYIYLEERRNDEQHAKEHALRVVQQFAIYQERQVNEARRLLMTLSHFPGVLQQDQAACSRLFSQIIEKDSEKPQRYVNLIAADSSGRLFGSARSVAILDFPVFQRTLAAKDFVVGELRTCEVIGKPIIHVGYPLLDRSGQVQAVIMAGLTLDWFHDLAVKMRLLSGSSICIIDNRGTIMARLYEPEKWVGQAKPEAGIIKTVLAQGEGVTAARGVDGNDRVYGFTKLPPLSGGGYIYVGIPYQAVYSQTFRSLIRNFFALGGVATLALLLAWLLGYLFVMRRLNVLLGTTQEVAAGDLSARTGLTYGSGVIDHLARSFDGMAQALQIREAQIIRQHDILSAINRIFKKALFQGSKEELGQICLAEALALTGSNYGFIGELNLATRLDIIAQVYPGAAAGKTPATAAQALPEPLEPGSAIDQVLNAGQPLILNDLGASPEEISASCPPLTAFLGVPLIQADKIIGIIGLVNKTGGYDAGDQEVLKTIAVATVQAFMGQLAEDKLAQLHKQHELILASATEGILGLDLHGNHTFVNPAAAAMLGYEAEELLGRPAHSTWHRHEEDGSSSPDKECHILRILKDGHSSTRIEEVLWRKDGTCFPVESNKNPIIQNGQVVGIVVTFTDISARKQAEKALRESEEHYRTLVQTFPYAIVTLDLNGLITAANDQASWITGYRIEGLINRNVLDFIPLSDRREERRTLKRIRETGSIRNRIVNVVRKDGTTFPAEVSVSLISDAQGQPKSMMAIFRDIAQRLQADKALKESMEKYRLLVNQIPAVVYKAAASCEVDFIDNKVETLTGYPKEYFDSRKLQWKELIHPEDLLATKQRFILALKTNKAYVRDYRICRKDGEIRWIHNRGNIFLDAAGKIDYVSGVLFDITDRKQAEEKLYRASRALRALGECNQALVHATAEMAFLQDVCRIIVEVTGYKLAWVGFPQHDAGKTVKPVAQMGRDGENADWINTSWADGAVRGLGPGGNAIRTGRTQVVRNILEDPVLAPWHEEVRRRGYNSIIVLPLTIEGETIAILDILSEDVDAFDAEEIKLLEELAANVSQGIAILRERVHRRQAMKEKARLEIQLRHAQKMEAIGTLANGIAHDFNNILTAIVGYSELILMNLDQKQDTQTIENHLMGVLQAGMRAKDLVQQILTFSRKKEQGKQPVQVNLIIQEALKLLRASLPTTIEIRSKIDPHAGMVLADPTQIHQVVMNIGTNAYHAMRDGGGILEVKLEAVEVDAGLARTHPHMNEGSYLKLTVRDTGCGMEPEVMERIFEPYFTTKGLSEGTGLGLAVVHGIVSSMGGAILVDSQIGRGSAFQVYFPRLDRPGQGVAPEAAAVEPIATSDRGEHILFIDDEPVLAHIGEKILKRLGYRVTVKTSSLEALELFRAQPDSFDLIISDQTMPQLTGVQLAQEITTFRPEMPIIICTGSSETVATENSTKQPFREYLMKPFNMGDLAKTIQRLLHPQED